MTVRELICRLGRFDTDLPVVMESDSGHFSDPIEVIRTKYDSVRDIPGGIVICSEHGYALKKSFSIKVG